MKLKNAKCQKLSNQTLELVSSADGIHCEKKKSKPISQ